MSFREANRKGLLLEGGHLLGLIRYISLIMCIMDIK